MARWRNPFAGARPSTVGIVCLTTMWAVFQWRDPTPPPVLDQILVAAFSVWFANEAIDRKKTRGSEETEDEDDE